MIVVQKSYNEILFERCFVVAQRKEYLDFCTHVLELYVKIVT